MLGTPVKKVSRNCGSSVDQPSFTRSSGSSSDSGESVFITQKPRRQRLRSSGVKTPRKEMETTNESCTSTFTSPRQSRRGKKHVNLPAYSFCLPHLDKPTKLGLNCYQNTSLHFALMGGFFNSVRQLQTGCQTADLLSSLPTVDQEGDFIAPISEEEEPVVEDVRVVKKKDFVVLSKTKRPQPWYDPHRMNQQSNAAPKMSHKAFRGASCVNSRNVAGKIQNRIQSEDSTVQMKIISQHEAQPDELNSDSDATFCELPEDCTQNNDGADEQEEPEAGGQNHSDAGDHQSVEKEMNRVETPEGLNITTISANDDEIPNPQPSVDEVDSLLPGDPPEERDSKQMKKKKKRRMDADVDRHVESDDNSVISNSDVVNEITWKKNRKIQDEDRHLNSDEATNVKNADFKIQKKKMKESNVTLDQTEQVNESVCLETPEASEEMSDKRKKKKKHHSESEENHGDVSFSHEAEKQNDGSTETTAEGAEDKDSQLATKKKKRRKQSLSLSSDTVDRSDDSVSAHKASTRTPTSFPAADAEESADKSAESSDHGQARKKKKRKLETSTNGGEPSETLQVDEAKRNKQEQSVVEHTGVCGSDAAGEQTEEDGAVRRKKKKKKKKEEEAPPAVSEYIQSELDSWSSAAHQASNDEKKKKKKKKKAKGETPQPESQHVQLDSAIDSCNSHTHDASNDEKKQKKKKKKKRESTDALSRSFSSETESVEENRIKVTTVSNKNKTKRNKIRLKNPSQDFFMDW